MVPCLDYANTPLKVIQQERKNEQKRKETLISSRPVLISIAMGLWRRTKCHDPRFLVYLYLSLVNLVVKGSYLNPNFCIVVVAVAMYTV